MLLPANSEHTPADFNMLMIPPPSMGTVVLCCFSLTITIISSSHLIRKMQSAQVKKQALPVLKEVNVYHTQFLSDENRRLSVQDLAEISGINTERVRQI